MYLMYSYNVEYNFTNISLDLKFKMFVKKKY
jgi:hypothetical protein